MFFDEERIEILDNEVKAGKSVERVCSSKARCVATSSTVVSQAFCPLLLF